MLQNTKLSMKKNYPTNNLILYKNLLQKLKNLQKPKKSKNLKMKKAICGAPIKNLITITRNIISILNLLRNLRQDSRKLSRNMMKNRRREKLREELHKEKVNIYPKSTTTHHLKNHTQNQSLQFTQSLCPIHSQNQLHIPTLNFYTQNLCTLILTKPMHHLATLDILSPISKLVHT